MALTYDVIATTSPTNNPTEITFSSIPGTYTDLVLVITAKVSATDDIYIRANSDGNSNYSYTILTGTGTTAYSARGSNISGGLIADFEGTPTTNNDHVCIAQFFNYSNATTNKTMLSRSNRAGSGTDAVVSLWRSTSAITTLALRCGTGATKTFSSGTVVTLYGIKAA